MPATPCPHCGASCDFTADPTHPCYGEVWPIEEIASKNGWIWLHACQGHRGAWDMLPYVPQQQETSE